MSKVKVVINQERFDAALLEAGGGHRGWWPVDGLDDPSDRGERHVAFEGGICLFASFMLAAVHHFGIYDATMLANMVREIQTDDSIVYYFPGLELL
jgi:hypothetical protein